MHPAETALTGTRPIAGASVFALLVALGAAVVLAAMHASPVPLALGTAGLVLSLLSRRRLRAHPELRGSRLSLAATILSAIVLLLTLPAYIVTLVDVLARAFG